MVGVADSSNSLQLWLGRFRAFCKWQRALNPQPECPAILCLCAGAWSSDPVGPATTAGDHPSLARHASGRGRQHLQVAPDPVHHVTTYPVHVHRPCVGAVEHWQWGGGGLAVRLGDLGLAVAELLARTVLHRSIPSACPSV